MLIRYDQESRDAYVTGRNCLVNVTTGNLNRRRSLLSRKTQCQLNEQNCIRKVYVTCSRTPMNFSAISFFNAASALIICISTSFDFKLVHCLLRWTCNRRCRLIPLSAIVESVKLARCWNRICTVSIRTWSCRRSRVVTACINNMQMRNSLLALWLRTEMRVCCMQFILGWRVTEVCSLVSVGLYKVCMITFSFKMSDIGPSINSWVTTKFRERRHYRGSATVPLEGAVPYIVTKNLVSFRHNQYLSHGWWTNKIGIALPSLAYSLLMPGWETLICQCTAGQHAIYIKVRRHAKQTRHMRIWLQCKWNVNVFKIFICPLQNRSNRHSTTN